MKIVAIGDTHGNHRDINLPSGDVLIHVGDYIMGYRSSPSPISDFRVWAMEQDFDHVICIAGNHDPINTGEILTTLSDIHYLQDSVIDIDGVKFGGSPWITPIYGNFNAEERDIDRAMRDLGRVDVLITHSPPYGILDDSSRGFNTGSRSIKEMVLRLLPKVHVFGHCHNRGGEFSKIGKTVFANVCVFKGTAIFEIEI